LFLYNQNFQFVLIFAIFFAVIYFSTKKVFKGETGIAIAVSVAISLIISLAMAKRGMLYDLLGGEIGSWAIVIGFFIVIVFLISLTYSRLGKGGTITIIWLLYLILLYADPGSRIPYGMLSWILGTIYDLMSGWLGIILMIVATIIIATKDEEIFSFAKKLFRH